VKSIKAGAYFREVPCGLDQEKTDRSLGQQSRHHRMSLSPRSDTRTNPDGEVM